MSVSFECCLLSLRAHCDGATTRPEESYRVWRVSAECDREASTIGPWPTRAVEPWEKNVDYDRRVQ